LHAARLAEKLGIRRVLIPSGAGVGSAFGFLEAPVAYEVARSRYVRLDDTFDASAVNALFAEMRAEAEAVVAAGAPGAQLIEARTADMRYRGQGHEITVDLPHREFAATSRGRLAASFAEAYAATYGRTIPGLDTEIMNWTLRLAAAQQPLPVCPPQPADRPARPRGRRTLFSATDLAPKDVATYRRDDLGPGCVIAGPAVIAEDDTTTIVPEGYTARLNPLSAIMLEKDTPG
jgi:N-methylhydantoinase A